MFADAYKTASGFTRPVILSHRAIDGGCHSRIAAFVVLNKDGWCLTAAHILEQLEAMMQAKEAWKDFEKERDKIEADAGLKAKAKKKKIRALARGKDFLTNHSAWWGGHGGVITDARHVPQGVRWCHALPRPRRTHPSRRVCAPS